MNCAVTAPRRIIIACICCAASALCFFRACIGSDAWPALFF
jgi:hypothetical protein